MASGPMFNEVIKVSYELLEALSALKKLATDHALTMSELKRGIANVEAFERNSIKETMRLQEEQRKISIQRYKDQQAERLRITQAGMQRDVANQQIRLAMQKDEQVENARILRAGREFAQRIEDSAQNHRIGREQAVHRQIMALRQQEAAASATSGPAGRTGAPFGGGLRIAAAAAGTMGNFQLASAFYGVERLEMATGILQKTFSGAGLAGGILVGVVAALGTGIIATMATANAFNQALARMSTLMDSGAAGTDAFRFALDKVALSAAIISTTFNMDLVDVVKGFQTALSSGIAVDQLEAFARTAATMSQSLGVGFSEATNLLTSFKDSYKLNINELSGVTDVLFNLVDVGKVNVSDLTSSFGRLAPIASAAGVSLKDAAAAVASLTRQGLTASQAITAVTRGIEAISSPSDNAKKQFEALGISFGAAALNGRSLLDYMTEVASKTGGSLEAISELFPEERARRFATALSNNLGLLADARNEMNKTGTASAAADKVMDTFGTKLGQVFGVIGNVVKLIGNDLLNAANTVFFGNGPISEATLIGVIKSWMRFKEIIVDITIVVFGLVKAFAQALAAAVNFVTLQWDKFGENLESIVGILPNMAKAMKDVHQSTNNQLDDMERRLLDLQYPQIAAQDAVKAAIVNKWKAENEGLLDATNGTTKLQEAYDKLRERAFRDRASPQEEETFRGFDEEIAGRQLAIDAAKAAARKKAVFDAALSTDTFIGKEHLSIPSELEQTFPKITELRYESFNRKMVRAVADAEAQAMEEIIKPMQKELDRFIALVNEKKASVSARSETQRAVSDREAAEKKEADERDRQDKAKERAAESFYDKVQSQYKEDVSKYEAYLKDKTKLHDKFTKKIKDNEDELASDISRLRAIFTDAAMANETDPGRKRRLAQGQFETAKSNLQAFSTNGGSSKQLDELQAQFERALKALIDASPDSKREAKKLEGEVPEFIKLLEAAVVKLNQGDAAAKAAAERAAKSVAKPTEAAAAAKVAAEAIERREILETINMNLNIKTSGDLSPEAEREVLAMIQQELGKRAALGTGHYYEAPSSMAGGPRNNDE